MRKSKQYAAAALAAVMSFAAAFISLAGPGDSYPAGTGYVGSVDPGYSDYLGGPGYSGSYGYGNPAYYPDWSSVGPGYEGTNPMGDGSAARDRLLSEGPGSDAGKKQKEDADNTLYIYSEYQGGTWEAQEDGSWKLKHADGQYASSEWALVDGKYYLLDMYGTMLTGFWRVNDKWYYFNSRGAMQTGWLLKNGKYYFLNADGSMAYGWVNSEGKWYFLELSTGEMLTNTYTPDGRYVNAEGVLIG